MSKRLGLRAATLVDVATAVGLSPAAASLALRGKPGVSEATRARVIDAARTLGYEPARRAPRQNRKPRTVGLVIKTLAGDAPERNRFYSPVMAGIEEACRTYRMNLMLATMAVDERNRPVEIPRIVTDRTCDGLIVVGVELSKDASEILRAGPPAVLVDAYASDDSFDTVESDNVLGAQTAVERLISLGHREIAILATGPHTFPSIVDRRRGYERAIADAGLPGHYIDVAYRSSEEVTAAALAYLRAHLEVSAVFCANDAVAMVLLRAASENGISVPERLSVVGFDDIDLAGHLSPPLTTMAVDKVGMGRIAVNVLAHRLAFANECKTRTLVRPTLVERATTRSVEPETDLDKR